MDNEQVICRICGKDDWKRKFKGDYHFPSPMRMDLNYWSDWGMEYFECRNCNYEQ